MRLTHFTDYAIRVLMYLALHPERLCSIHEVAKAYGISQNHLMKVVSELASAGFLDAVRGRKGGLRLSRPADRITLGALVRRTEGDVDVVDCRQCTLVAACGMATCFDDAVSAFFRTLDGFTLADIMSNGKLAALLPASRLDSEQARKVAPPAADER